MGALGLVSQHGLILLDRCATIDHGRAHLGHVFRETSILISDLVGQLTRVAQHNNGDFTVHRLELLQRRQYKHSRLTHTRLGLAHHIHTQDRLRNALLLDFRWVLETKITDRTQKLGLQQEVTEAG